MTTEPRPLKHRYDCAYCGRPIDPDQLAMTHTDGRVIHAGCVAGLTEDDAA